MKKRGPQKAPAFCKHCRGKPAFREKAPAGIREDSEEARNIAVPSLFPAVLSPKERQGLEALRLLGVAAFEEGEGAGRNVVHVDGAGDVFVNVVVEQQMDIPLRHAQYRGIQAVAVV